MKNIKKIIAGVSALTLLAMNVAFAAQVGTGTYSDTGATSVINWDGNLPGTASGTLDVQVTANVAPVISFNLSKSAINLGTLTVGSYVTGSLDYSSTTNAVNGVNVSLTSATLLKEAVTNQLIGATGQAGTLYKFATGATAIASGTDFVATSALPLDGRVTKGTLSNTVTLGAQIAADTTSGNYSDTLTFTVTGNF